MQPYELADQIACVADAAEQAGQRVEIDWVLPTVLVFRGEDDEFFFQEHEAENLIDEAQKTVDLVEGDASLEDVILWQAQGW